MKRDMDLIRRIMLDLEKLDENGNGPTLQYDDVSIVDIVYHMELLNEHGLIEAEIIKSDGDPKSNLAAFERITWKGHDFIDNAKSETVWQTTKRNIADTVGSVGFALFVETMKYHAREMLGINGR